MLIGCRVPSCWNCIRCIDRCRIILEMGLEGNFLVFGYWFRNLSSFFNLIDARDKKNFGGKRLRNTKVILNRSLILHVGSVKKHYI